MTEPIAASVPAVEKSSTHCPLQLRKLLLTHAPASAREAESLSDLQAAVDRNSRALQELLPPNLPNANVWLPKDAPTPSCPMSEGLVARRKMTMGLTENRLTGRVEWMSKGEAAVDKGDKGDKNHRPNKIKVIENKMATYKLGDEVMPSGNPGMQVVSARRISDGKEMVIKVRNKSESFGSKKLEQKWRQGTEFLLRLPQSANIVQIHEVIEDKCAYYVVMEKIDGIDLFEMVPHRQCLPLGEVKAILRGLLRGVRDLHAWGCIHRDLKLENVMVDKAPGSPRGRRLVGKRDSGPASLQEECQQHLAVVKLIDFDDLEIFAPSARARTVVGSNQYIAPEAYSGQYSPRSDIFAVGVIAYRLMTGRFPFKFSMFDDEPGENWVGSPRMKGIQERLENHGIDFSRPPFSAEPRAQALVRSMLATNEKERPTAEQCLKHAFFQVAKHTPQEQ